MPDSEQKFESWGVVEMLGHRRIAGFITEQTIAGSALVRVDVPETEKPGYTKLVGVGSIYCLTPTSEAVARAVASELERYNEPLPVHLPRLPATVGAPAADAEIEDDNDDVPWEDEDQDKPF